MATGGAAWLVWFNQPLGLHTDAHLLGSCVCLSPTSKH